MVLINMVRIRRHDCDYRDLTIRSISRNGGKTELQKLREGFGDWYIYCWTNEKQQINEWMLINLNCVRESGLLGIYREDIPNGDGTFFRVVSFTELRLNKCITSYNYVIDSSPLNNPLYINRIE